MILNAVRRTSGPGNPRIVRHEVDEGVIVDFTPDGVPIVDTVAILLQSGQFDWRRSCRRAAPHSPARRPAAGMLQRLAKTLGAPVTALPE